MGPKSPLQWPLQTASGKFAVLGQLTDAEHHEASRRDRHLYTDSPKPGKPQKNDPLTPQPFGL